MTIPESKRITRMNEWRQMIHERQQSGLSVRAWCQQNGMRENSYASASVVTDVLTKKYVDAMPLDRQEQMWKRMGVALKRGTMANWVIQVADLYLRSFWKRIRSELLTQSTIHADETVMQVHKENGRPDTSESRMWVYSSGKRADIQLRCFEYRESRSGKWATAHGVGHEKLGIKRRKAK